MQWKPLKLNRATSGIEKSALIKRLLFYSMRSFCNKNMVSFTPGQGFPTCGSRTPRGSREDFQGYLNGSWVFMYYNFLISYTVREENMCRLKTLRGFSRCCDATMRNPRLFQQNCASSMCVRLLCRLRNILGDHVNCFMTWEYFTGKRLRIPALGVRQYTYQYRGTVF